MSKRLLFLLFLLLILVLGGGIFYYLRFLRPGSEGEVSEEETTPQEYTCDGQIYTNARQGYKVCYPADWHTRDFGYSQLGVGFDPFPIPEASEYGGIFTVNVSRQGSAAVLTDHLGGLVDPTTETVTVDGVTAIKVSGTIPSDNVFFPSYFEVTVVFENFDRTYAIDLLSSPDNYEVNILQFESFVESFMFLDDVSSPPWGQDIFLFSPWPADSVSESFRVAGEAKGAFEATIVARLKNDAGDVLLEEPIIYNAPDVGELGYFDVAVTFETTASSGILEVFHTSAKDGSIVDLVSVHLDFE